MEINDNYIKIYFTKKCANNKYRILKSRLKKIQFDNPIYQYLNNRYCDSYSVDEGLYRICHNIEIKGCCPICGKPIKLISFKYGFGKTCQDRKCIVKFKKSNSSFNYIETQQKVKKTMQRKYGVSNAYNIKWVKEKCIANAQSSEAKLKRTTTNMSKYGVDNPIKNPQVIIKCKQTQISKYGSLYRNTKEYLDKTFKTNNRKFGTNWASQSLQIKEKIKTTFFKKYGKSSYLATEECQIKSHSLESKLKRNKTIEEKYGNMNFFNTSYYKDKSNQTKLVKGTFNSSKSEFESYKIILDKYPDTIRQYSSKEYPFNCDFYIPSIDTYIEYNEFWTHGNHPFNQDDDEDMKKLEFWKSKHQKFYDNAIYVWTNLDMRKRQAAKENNLYYIEFWNLDEVKQWIS